jgi:hypothetical protein
MTRLKWGAPAETCHRKTSTQAATSAQVTTGAEATGFSSRSGITRYRCAAALRRSAQDFPSG